MALAEFLMLLDTRDASFTLEEEDEEPVSDGGEGEGGEPTPAEAPGRSTLGRDGAAAEEEDMEE